MISQQFLAADTETKKKVESKIEIDIIKRLAGL